MQLYLKPVSAQILTEMA